MHSTPTSSPAQKRSLLRNRNFVLLWIAQAISLMGDVIFDLTLVIWIAADLAQGMTWAPLAVSGILLAAALPVALVGPLAGVFVDRWDKRRTMLWMDLFRVVLILSLLLITGIIPLPWLTEGNISLPVQLGAIYTVVFLAATCSQFFNPSRLALTGDVVDEEQRAQATGFEQGTQSIAILLGPPLAAPLLLTFGIEWALLINALSFGVSFLFLAAMRIPASARSVQPGQTGNVIAEFKQGLHFAFGHRILRGLIIGSFIVMLGGGAFNALTIFFFLENLRAPLALIGLIDTVFGVGIIAGAVLFGSFAQRIGLERTLSWSILAVGVLFLVLARMTNLAFAMGLIVLLGICQAAVSVVVGPLLLKFTPRELVGRVSAVLNPSATLASLIAITLAGYLASTVLADLNTTVLGIPFGPIDTIFTGAGLLVVLAGLYLFSALRVTTPETTAHSEVAEAKEPVME